MTEQTSFVSYHNHTAWSDGIASVPEMIAAAQAAGLAEVGISDHFILSPYPDLDVSWAMPADGLARYVDEVLAAARAAKMIVRLGVEVDFFPETFSDAMSEVARFPFDYVIGGVHFANDFPIDYAPEPWLRLEQAGVDTVHATYWQRVTELARTGGVDIVAHLDLPKKFAFPVATDFSSEIAGAVAAVAQAGIVAELNTAGWDKPCREPYPAPSLLAQCCRAGIPALLSADGHATDEIARHFSRGAEELRRVGYVQTNVFEQRQSRRVALPGATTS